jgi:hypothetical protein
MNEVRARRDSVSQSVTSSTSGKLVLRWMNLNEVNYLMNIIFVGITLISYVDICVLYPHVIGLYSLRSSPEFLMIVLDDLSSSNRLNILLSLHMYFPVGPRTALLCISVKGDNIPYFND